jgi:hypothetical protein
VMKFAARLAHSGFSFYVCNLLILNGGQRRDRTADARSFQGWPRVSIKTVKNNHTGR